MQRRAPFILLTLSLACGDETTQAPPTVGPELDAEIDRDDGSDTGADSDCGSPTDPENCGACGHSCLGGECVGGACQPILVYSPDPSCQPCTPIPLRVKEGQIFFSESPGTLVMIETGGQSRVLAEDPTVTGLAVSGQEAFWVDVYSGTVRTMTVPFGTPLTLLMTARPFDITLADGEPFVYVAAIDSGEILRIARSDGTFDVVASGHQPYQIVSSSRVVVWTEAVPDGAVMKLDKETEAIDAIASGQAKPRNVALGADGYAYWGNVEATTGTVVRAPIDGGPVEPLSDSPAPISVAVDATHVYWTSIDTVWRAPVNGGESERVASATPSEIDSVAVDDSWVYWGVAGPGEVYKVAK